ncbi:MAG: type II 3-dehydroquinate dehydratase [Bacteroidota bacterium]
MKLAIINGPNLNLLGLRQPEIYGVQSFNDFYEDLKKKYPQHEFSYFQSNIEGELIDKVHEFGMSHEGLIINAGAYTHTSIALADAVAAIKTPAVEVHISNIFSREDYRHVSFLGAQCKGSISGFGLNSYHLAIQSFI